MHRILVEALADSKKAPILNFMYQQIRGINLQQIIDKKRILQAMEELPEDATVEQAMYKLYVLDQVSKAFSHNGENVPHEDVRNQFLNNN